MGVVALVLAGGALGVRVAVVVPIIIIVVVVVVVVVVMVVIPVVVSIVVSIVVPTIIPIIIMMSLIPILRDTSLTQRNQRRRLLPLADTLGLRSVIVMHRVALVRDAHHRTADFPAAIRDIVAVEGVA